jgi:hypothetical protein
MSVVFVVTETEHINHPESSGRKTGLLLSWVWVFTQGLVVPKPDSATVLSKSSRNMEGYHTLYSRYCSCSVFIVFAHLSCTSLSGTFKCDGMWMVSITVRARIHNMWEGVWW